MWDVLYKANQAGIIGLVSIIIIIVAFVFYGINTKRERDLKTEQEKLRDDERKIILNALNTQNAKLDDHIDREESQIQRSEEKIDKLSSNVHDIQVVLAAKHMTKTDLDNGIWKKIITRLEETADICFDGTFDGCDFNNCQYCDFESRFTKLAIERRKESWVLWERAAFPRRILNIVEEIYKYISKDALDIVLDITTTCKNDKLTATKKKEIVFKKVVEGKEHIKSECSRRILEQVNLKA